MRNDWVLDVLTDLRTFAESNSLPELAENLDNARIVATKELALAEAIRVREVAQSAGDGTSLEGNLGVHTSG